MHYAVWALFVRITDTQGCMKLSLLGIWTNSLYSVLLCIYCVYIYADVIYKLNIHVHQYTVIIIQYIPQLCLCRIIQVNVRHGNGN